MSKSIKVRCIKELSIPINPISQWGITSAKHRLWVKGQNYDYLFNPDDGYFILDKLHNIYIGPYDESVFWKHFITLEELRDNIINNLQ